MEYTTEFDNRYTPDEFVDSIPVWTIGDRMRKALDMQAIAKQDMADYLGVSRNTVSRWINNQVAPPSPVCRLWSLRCGVSLQWLTLGDVAMLGSGLAKVENGRVCTVRDLNPEPAD